MKTIDEKEKLLDDLILLRDIVLKFSCEKCTVENCNKDNGVCVEAFQNIRKNALENIYRG